MSRHAAIFDLGFIDLFTLNEKKQIQKNQEVFVYFNDRRRRRLCLGAGTPTLPQRSFMPKQMELIF